MLKMTSLTERQIAKIVQYWEHRENLEKEISQIQAKYYRVDELTDDEEDDWRYKATNKGYVRANRRLDAQIDELRERIVKLDAAYEKWLNEKVGLELRDRDQDEFTYNLLNNGVKITV